MKVRRLVLVATYNERMHVESLCLDVLGLGLGLDLLFVDDNSNDGTGTILDSLASRFANVNVMHRAGKLGVGSAHRDGIEWAYRNGYAQLITMDCDRAHDPRCIPELLSKTEAGADVVVGSRYLRKTGLSEWNLYRRALTHLGHLATRCLLGMSYDATGAYRCYRLDRVPRHLFDLVTSRGYSFFYESLYVLHRNGFRIDEVAVALPKDTYAHSKMGFREIYNSARLLIVIFAKTLLTPEKYEVGEALVLDPERDEPRHADNQIWDAYWENEKTKAGRFLYDAVASCYRRLIIRRALNRFVDAYFRPGAEVLHAGCGSGQVDAEIRHRVSITGMDISVEALRLYKRVNRNYCRVIHGSILEIPLPDSAVDGVYNLGVMEHFTEVEIRRILAEFRRVLRRGGRALIFWPPELGSSVLFFKALKLFFAVVLRRKNVRFHPDEITRVRSRQHVLPLFEQCGLKVVRYYFGPLDAFTHVVIVAERAEEFEARA